MTFKDKILVTIVVIVAFDAVSSLVSRVFHFDYNNLIGISLVIYVAAGYWGAHLRGFLFGLLLGAVAGLAHATFGWWVSTWIRSFGKTGMPPIGLSLQLIVIISV